METKLTELCRYFGTNDGFQKNAVAYFYEKKWVSQEGDFPLDDYTKYGLDRFSESDGVPKTLKAMLLDRFLKSNGICVQTVELFKNWYRNYYLFDK